MCILNRFGSSVVILARWNSKIATISTAAEKSWLCICLQSGLSQGNTDAMVVVCECIALKFRNGLKVCVRFQCPALRKKCLYHIGTFTERLRRKIWYARYTCGSSDGHTYSDGSSYKQAGVSFETVRSLLTRVCTGSISMRYCFTRGARAIQKLFNL